MPEASKSHPSGVASDLRISKPKSGLDLNTVGAENRLQYIDGLRGFAIILVVLYHVYARWCDVVPFGSAYAGFRPFHDGWLGVHLFFMISGYVILMTLEKTSGFLAFMGKRWLRLFPAMLIASILVYSTAGWFQQRPNGQPVPTDLLSGLLFIHPAFLNFFFGTSGGQLEGAFWSLYVEMEFYLIFGLTYYLFKERAAIAVLFVFQILAIVVALLLKYKCDVLFDPVHVSRKVTLFWSLFMTYFSWFIVGIYVRKFVRDGNPGMMLRAHAFAALSIACVWLFEEESMEAVTAATLAYLAFILPVFSGRLRNLFANRGLLFFGLISYPLYLIHENLLIAMTVQMGRLNLPIPGLLLPVIPLTLVCGAAYIIAKFEPRIRRRILKVVSPRATATGLAPGRG